MEISKFFLFLRYIAASLTALYYKKRYEWAYRRIVRDLEKLFASIKKDFPNAGFP